VLSAWKRRFADPLCLPRPGAVQCLRGEEALGALQQQGLYRLYSCHRCGVQVRICQRCDHGNIYCGRECSAIRRRESLRRAGARYQSTRRGAARHAARQRGYRVRQQKVTHQGCEGGARAGTVAAPPSTKSEPTDAPAIISLPTRSSSEPLSRCALCGELLPQWTRPRLWLWSG
jgi:hypothetical protein